MCDERQEIGRRGEAIAVAYLCARGWTIEARRYRCRGGEADIVASRTIAWWDGEPATLVAVVEVKARRSDYERPEASVGPRKRACMEVVARAWQAECAGERVVIRFDVIAVVMRGAEVEVEHFASAFEASG